MKQNKPIIKPEEKLEKETKEKKKPNILIEKFIIKTIFYFLNHLKYYYNDYIVFLKLFFEFHINLLLIFLKV